MKNKLLLVPIMSLVLILFYACSGGQQNNSHEYPKTGSVDRLHPSLDKIIAPGERPEIIAEGFDWSEGPLWLPEQEILIFSDIPKNSIYQWSEKDSLKLYLKPSGYTDSTPRGGETGSNGLLLNPKGKLVLCQHGDRRMAVMDAPLNAPAPEFTSLISSWENKSFNSPNDAVYSAGGDLYFTDPAYGMEFGYKDPTREMDFTGVFKFSAEGEISLLTDQLSAPNGIALSPDEKNLYVANSGGGEKSIWMIYDFAEDGSLANGKVFHDASVASDSLRGAPDGLDVRSDGIIFATGPGGVWIFTPEGENLGIVKTGQATSNCTLDSDDQYLYMTADMYLMRIKLVK